MNTSLLSMLSMYKAPRVKRKARDFVPMLVQSNYIRRIVSNLYVGELPDFEII